MNLQNARRAVDDKAVVAGSIGDQKISGVLTGFTKAHGPRKAVIEPIGDFPENLANTRFSGEGVPVRYNSLERLGEVEA